MTVTSETDTIAGNLGIKYQLQRVAGQLARIMQPSAETWLLPPLLTTSSLYCLYIYLVQVYPKILNGL